MTLNTRVKGITLTHALVTIKNSTIHALEAAIGTLAAPPVCVTLARARGRVQTTVHAHALTHATPHAPPPLLTLARALLLQVFAVGAADGGGGRGEGVGEGGEGGVAGEGEEGADGAISAGPGRGARRT